MISIITDKIFRDRGMLRRVSAYANVYTYGYFNFTREIFIPSSEYGCREEFMTGYSGFKDDGEFIGFGLGLHKGVDISKLKNFIDKVLEVMNKPGTIETHETNKENFVIFKVDRFWYENSLRCEFLTILLRCYNFWYQKNQNNDGDIWQILAAYAYFHDTMEAVRHFMDGHFNPNNWDGRDWCDHFNIDKGYYIGERKKWNDVGEWLNSELVKP